MVLLKFFDGTSHLHCTYGHALELQQPPSQMSRCRRLLEAHDAVKASVPKLFGCPGSPSALSGFRFGDLPAAQKTYNTVGSRLLRCKSPLDPLRSFGAALSPLGSCAVQKHNTPHRAPVNPGLYRRVTRASALQSSASGASASKAVSRVVSSSTSAARRSSSRPLTRSSH